MVPKNHIEELVNLLKEKGYPDEFRINAGPSMSLQAGLEAYLDPNQVLPGGHRFYPMHLITYSRYKHHEDRILCAFQVNYGETKGFGVEGMRISRYSGKNKKPSNKVLFVDAWNMVVTAAAANKMMGLVNKQKRKGL